MMYSRIQGRRAWAVRRAIATQMTMQVRLPTTPTAQSRSAARYAMRNSQQQRRYCSTDWHTSDTTTDVDPNGRRGALAFASRTEIVVVVPTRRRSQTLTGCSRTSRRTNAMNRYCQLNPYQQYPHRFSSIRFKTRTVRCQVSCQQLPTTKIVRRGRRNATFFISNRNNADSQEGRFRLVRRRK